MPNRRRHGAALVLDIAQVLITRGHADISAPGGPELSLSPSALSFSGVVSGANPATQSFTVSNPGDQALTGLGVAVALSSGSGWATGTLSATTIPAGGSVTCTVTLSTGALGAGDRTATLTFSATDVANQVGTAALTMVSSTTITVSPLTESFVATEGGANVPTQRITITNNGPSAISGLALTSAASWITGLSSLSATSLASGASATADLGINLTGLTNSASPYSGTVHVNATGPTNTPVDVTVSAQINAAITGATNSVTHDAFPSDSSLSTGDTARHRAMVAVTPGWIKVSDVPTKVRVMDITGGTVEVACISRCLQGGSISAPRTLYHTAEVDGSGVYTIPTAGNRTPEMIEVEWDGPVSWTSPRRWRIDINATRSAGTLASFQGYRHMSNGANFSFSADHTKFAISQPVAHADYGSRRTYKSPSGDLSWVLGSGSTLGAGTHTFWLVFRRTQKDFILIANPSFLTAQNYTSIVGFKLVVPAGASITPNVTDLVAAGCTFYVNGGVTINGATASANLSRNRLSDGMDQAMFMLGPVVCLPACQLDAEADTSSKQMRDSLVLGDMMVKSETDTWTNWDYKGQEYFQDYMLNYESYALAGINRDNMFVSSSASYDPGMVCLLRWWRTGEMSCWFIGYDIIIRSRKWAAANTSQVSAATYPFYYSVTDYIKSPFQFAFGYLFAGWLLGESTPDTQDYFRVCLRDMCDAVHISMTNNRIVANDYKARAVLREERGTGRALAIYAAAAWIDYDVPQMIPTGPSATATLTQPFTWYDPAQGAMYEGGGWDRAWDKGLALLENTQGSSGVIYQAVQHISFAANYVLPDGTVAPYQPGKGFMAGLNCGAIWWMNTFGLSRLPAANAPGYKTRGINIVVKHANWILTCPQAWDGDLLENGPSGRKAFGATNSLSYIMDAGVWGGAEYIVPTNDTTYNAAHTYYDPAPSAGQLVSGVWTVLSGSAAQAIFTGGGKPYAQAPDDGPLPHIWGPFGYPGLGGLTSVIFRYAFENDTGVNKNKLGYRFVTCATKATFRPTTDPRTNSPPTYDQFSGTNKFTAVGQWGKNMGEATWMWPWAQRTLAQFIANGEVWP